MGHGRPVDCLSALRGFESRRIRKSMKYHYVYEIQNLIDGKIYVGKHSTSDMNDGYMGSGYALNEAIKKDGIENFRKRIIKECSSAEEALQHERSIVDQAFVDDENTYNLVIGGNGGWSVEASSRGGNSTWSNPHWRTFHQSRSSERMKRLHQEGRIHPPSWIGRSHNDDTKQKIAMANAISQRGNRNSQFGKVWVLHEEQCKCRSIKNEELADYLAAGWRRDRKMKW